MNKFIFAIILGFVCSNCYAQNVTTEDQTVVEQRFNKEQIVEENPFAISFYKQNYVLPFYYTGSPYNSVYQGAIPPNQSIKRQEIKYQLSFKVPVWKHILSSNSSLYFAYTQLSYWQAYNKNAFFRETDFQPEVFLRNEIHCHMFGDLYINLLNIGVIHESNGFGNHLERSWNRVYLEAVASNENWLISVRPWYVIKDSTYNKFNPNLANYLGYGDITIAYKFAHQVISLRAHSLIEQGGKRATVTANYTFPITRYINGFVQVFHGYGQSLIEYDHKTTSAGVGIAFNNLI